MQSGVDPSNYNTIQQPEDVHHKHTNTSIPNINSNYNPKPFTANNIHDILDEQLK